MRVHEQARCLALSAEAQVAGQCRGEAQVAGQCHQQAGAVLLAAEVAVVVGVAVAPALRRSLRPCSWLPVAVGAVAVGAGLRLQGGCLRLGPPRDRGFVRVRLPSRYRGLLDRTLRNSPAGSA